MKKCVIFCAGDFKEPIELIRDEDVLIAADGGLVYAQMLGLVPNVILGDFDSLGYVPQGAEVYPVEKDDTDCMLAIKKGFDLGCDTFIIYGGMDGDRVDHTVANFQALHYIAQRGGTGILVGNRQIATVLRNGSMQFPPCFVQYLSIFCMGGDAKGVTIRGMQYEMEDGTLTADMPLGVSNCFIRKKATISVRDGALLLIWKQGNGLP